MHMYIYKILGEGVARDNGENHITDCASNSLSYQRHMSRCALLSLAALRVYIYICKWIYICIYVHMRNICVFVCICICRSIYVYVCMYVYMCNDLLHDQLHWSRCVLLPLDASRVFIHMLSMNICTWACLYIYIYTYSLYIYIYIHTCIFVYIYIYIYVVFKCIFEWIYIRLHVYTYICKYV